MKAVRRVRHLDPSTASAAAAAVSPPPFPTGRPECFRNFLTTANHSLVRSIEFFIVSAVVSKAAECYVRFTPYYWALFDVWSEAITKVVVSSYEPEGRGFRVSSRVGVHQSGNILISHLITPSELFVPRRVSLEISRLEISRRKVLLLWTYCDIVVRGAICYFLNSHTRVFCLGTRSAGKCAIFRATMTSRQPRQVRTRGMEPPYGTDQISALILHPIISAVSEDSFSDCITCLYNLYFVMM